MSDTGEIYGRLAKVMGAVGSISKSRRNQQQGYNFRGIDDVYNELHEALAEHQVVPITRVLKAERTERPSKSGGVMFQVILTVETRFYAPDGSSVAAETIGESMDSGDKASNKAMSAAMKYALLQTFCIPTEEKKDSEEDSPEVRPGRHGTRGEPAATPAVVHETPPGTLSSSPPPAPRSPGKPSVPGVGGPITEEEQLDVLLDEAETADAAKSIGVRAKAAGLMALYEKSLAKYRRLSKGAA